jgi:hypothetical protein
MADQFKNERKYVTYGKYGKRTESTGIFFEIGNPP